MNQLTPPTLDLSSIDPESLSDPQTMQRCANELLEDVLQQMARSAGQIAWSQLTAAQQAQLQREQYVAETARGFLHSLDHEDRESLRQHIVNRLQAHQENSHT